MEISRRFAIKGALASLAYLTAPQLRNNVQAKSTSAFDQPNCDESYIRYNGQLFFKDFDPSSRHAFRLEDNQQVVRFECRQQDNQSWGKYSTYRSHLYQRSELIAASENRYIPFGKDYWASWKFLVEPGVVTTTDPIIGQFHNVSDFGEGALSPPLHFRLRRDHFAVMTHSDEAQLTSKSLVYPPESTSVEGLKTIQRYISPTAIPRGVWHQVVVRAVFDFLEGELEVWFDGSQVVGGRFPLGYNDRVGPYFQFGIYRYLADETLAVRYRAVEFGPESLAHLIRRST